MSLTMRLIFGSPKPSSALMLAESAPGPGPMRPGGRSVTIDLGWISIFVGRVSPGDLPSTPMRLVSARGRRRARGSCRGHGRYDAFMTAKSNTRSATAAPAGRGAYRHDAPSLSAEQLAELLRLVKGADSVELKLSVPDTNRRSAVRALGIDPLQAQIRQVVFFDTPELQLSGRGIVVRARRVQAKAGDAVVKLRPVEPGLLDPVVLGPVNVFKLKFMPEGFNRRLVAELWFYPDGSRILELSTKCPPGDAFTAAAETKAFLGAKGIDLGAPQQTKTRSALEFFAKELKDSEAA
jgi:hypothetical protein